ncbi:probable protein FAN at N-terminal half [Coccomyxa sp. Obi]|nr:probable protein FAN at N-terminal half [Coccomyxa sp. Obi]
MSAWDGEERFSLLLLEEEEYYFRDYSCLYLKDTDTRVPGHLKVCSAALYFVPRAVQEPIFRVPYRSTSHIERVWDDERFLNDDTFYITASERVDMKKNNQNIPYTRSTGLFEFRFQLVYASLDEVLPKVQELWDVAQQIVSKENHQRGKQRLAAIIQGHEEAERFNPGWLEDENEKILVELLGSCVTPLCSQPGRVALTATRIYFQPFNVASNLPIQTYLLNKAQSLIKRTYLLQNIGLEIFFSGRNSLYLTFKSTQERNTLAGLLEQQSDLKLRKRKDRKTWRRDWQRGRVSNFDYLMFLNREAGRSFMDLTQYPVFPWVIQDYGSASLDLSDPQTFRDLSKPIGALSPRRFRDFMERYREQKMMSEWTFTKVPGMLPPLQYPPFMYGCHYSTPGYVVFYLMRSQPQLMLRLQNGRFDAPDRLFWSVLDTWKSVMTLPTDVKELIPEFYSDPSFLINNEKLNFGDRAAGARVNDVELPPWASDAADFVAKLAEALESPHVSGRLHQWIDLIFGCKSRGAAAEKADNVFHHLTYDDIALAQLEQEKDAGMREALRLQMMEFGRTPKQLFTKPHPKRRVAVTGGPLLNPFCGGCFGSSGNAAPSVRPANVLHPTFVQGASSKASPVSKAVERLMSRKRPIREATLAWLEAAARTREPEYMQLSSHTELLPLIKAAQAPGAQGTVMKDVLARALRALAVAPLNCSLILDAGGLQPLSDMLGGNNPELAHQAVAVMSLLTKEDDQRLKTLSGRTVEHILALLPARIGNTPRNAPAQPNGGAFELTGADVRMSAASTIANLSQSLTNRNTICGLGGPMMLLAVAQQEDEVPSVRREAIAALVPLLEDDMRKEELAERGGLPVLVALAQSEDVVLRDLQAASTRCLALLSTSDALKPRLAAAGLLPLLCSAAHPSGEPTADAELQRPAAAALANLCSDPSLAQQLVGSGGMSALVELANSSDREVQRHTARAFWHLASMEGPAAEAAVQSESLGALLRLAAPEGKQGAQMARQALRRLCEDPSVGEALLAEVAKGSAGTAPHITKSPSAYIQQLIGTPGNSEYNTPTDTPSGTPYRTSTGSPFRMSSALRHQNSSTGNLSGDGSVPQGSPLGGRRRHRRMSSGADMDGVLRNTPAPSPLKSQSSGPAAPKPEGAEPLTPRMGSAAPATTAPSHCNAAEGGAGTDTAGGSAEEQAGEVTTAREPPPEDRASSSVEHNAASSSEVDSAAGAAPHSSGGDVGAAASAGAGNEGEAAEHDVFFTPTKTQPAEEVPHAEHVQSHPIASPLTTPIATPIPNGQTGARHTPVQP